jgi:predicted aspartyl protease
VPRTARHALVAVVVVAVSLLALGALSAPADAATTVPIRVLKHGNDTLALAPVAIHRRSYFFILDTGASTSVIGRSVARRLGLPERGRPVRVAGVFGTGLAQPVRIRGWHIGAAALPSLRIVSFDVGARNRIVGLLGSDVLARFGRITIDYAGRTLTLGV